MSIIQRIREKAAWFLFIAIGVSLLGFLVQDAFVGKTGRGLFGGSTTTVGSVNGKKIEVAEYEQKIKQMEDQYQNMGYPMNDMMRQSVRENAWNQLIGENNINEEVNKLGLSVTPKELEDMLFGPNAPEEFKKQFTNEQGVYDVNAAKTAIAQLRKQKSTMADNFNNVYLPALVNNRLHEKFVSLLSNTAYFPKWMLEKMNSDNNSLAAVSYVNVPYSTISDSSIKISDEEITAYVNNHKEEFKQENSRSIAYVVFDASPSAADTASLTNNMELLKKEMATTPEADINTFLAKNGSQINFMDSYVSKTAIQVPNKDSIMALHDGAVYGPYLDAGNLTIAKKLSEKVLPDSVKARHILIATTDRSGQPLMPDSVAEKRIDSIKLAIEHGSRFDSLAAKFSASPEGQSNGGDLGYFANGRMVKEFNDFCFSGKTGDRKVVKTQFGYHLVEIEDQKNFNPAYKIAYFSKTISPSQETDEKASGLASQFASESRNAKAFDDNAKKRNYNKLLAADIKPNDMNIAALGSNRQMVKWIYDADRGDVSEMFTIDNKYVVATVTEINKEGIASAAKARPMVEYLIRNQKKAEQIKKKIGTANTLEAVATATNQQVLKADSVAFSTPFFPGAGQEGKVGGYVFNAAAKGKASPLIAGNGGVYSIRTENVYAKSNNDAGLDQQKTSMIQNQKAASGRGVIEAALKKAADIKDTRSRIF
ncbi:MAG TPA: SurA N-terminal domain-containing protein [Chitinophagaceae bacterium]|nr:SurA N-terminal domain-containing protein [Chitinophagaceae bacterium]